MQTHARKLWWTATIGTTSEVSAVLLMADLLKVGTTGSKKFVVEGATALEGKVVAFGTYGFVLGGVKQDVDGFIRRRIKACGPEVAVGGFEISITRTEKIPREEYTGQPALPGLS